MIRVRAWAGVRALACAGALALLGYGCAHRASAPAAPLASGSRVAVAMLPIENLTGQADVGDRITRVVWTALGSDGRFEAIEPGEVENVTTELRIRSSSSLTRDQLTRAAGKLHVRWMLAGDALECGTVHTPDGDVPTFALSLRLLDGTSGRVVWTDMLARSGEDRETVFGWGREASLDKLMERTARELLARVRIPAVADTAAPSAAR